MARSRVTLRIVGKGVGELLRSPGVKADVRARAQRVAGQVSASTDMRVIVEDRTGVRARYRVVIDDPGAKAQEAKDRTLGRAIDAARG